MPLRKPETEESSGMTATHDVRQLLQARGVALVPAALHEDQLRFLLSAMRLDEARGAVRHRSGQTYGVRALLAACPELAAHLELLLITQFASEASGRRLFPIDAIFFDKHAEANWAVPAHQDVVVPVPSGIDDNLVRRQRVRDGLTYAEPPESVLTALLAVRIHFNVSDENSGGLYVVPGSHLRGRVRETEISHLPIDAYEPCSAGPGDLLLMKPLVIHRSGTSTRSTHRRALHILYAPVDGWHGRLLHEAA